MSTYIELEPGIEVIVGHDVNLGKASAHTARAASLQDANNGGFSTGLLLGLGIVLKHTANRLQDVGHVRLRASVWDLECHVPY